MSKNTEVITADKIMEYFVEVGRIKLALPNFRTQFEDVAEYICTNYLNDPTMDLLEKSANVFCLGVGLGHEIRRFAQNELCENVNMNKLNKPIAEGNKLLEQKSGYYLKTEDVKKFVELFSSDPWEAITSLYALGVCKGSRIQKKKGVSAATPTPKAHKHK